MARTDNLYRLPENLPAPADDGACDHLPGMRLPSLPLRSTAGDLVDLPGLPARPERGGGGRLALATVTPLSVRAGPRSAAAGRAAVPRRIIPQTLPREKRAVRYVEQPVRSTGSSSLGPVLRQRQEPA